MRAARARAASRRGCVCAISASAPAPELQAVLRQLGALAGAGIAGDDQHLVPLAAPPGCRSRLAEIGSSGSCLKTSGRSGRCARRRLIRHACTSSQRLSCAARSRSANILAARASRAPPWRESAARISRSRRATRLGIDVELAGEIGRREQQVADLLEDLPRAAAVRLPCAAASRTSASSSATLSAVWLGMLEIETDAGRPLAQFVGAHQRGQRPSGTAVERRLSAAPRSRRP